MNSILFVTPVDFHDPYVTGGAYGSKLHFDTLTSLQNVTITTLSLSRTITGCKEGIIYIPATKNKLDTLIRNCQGYASYLTPQAEHIILEYIKSNSYDILFLDISNFGRIAEKVKKEFPSIKIITFFHNVEYIYVRSKIRVEGLQYLPMLYASFYNEKLAAQYSDKIIAITEQDKQIIADKYKAHVTDIFMPWYDEYIVPEEYKIKPVSIPLEVLFLGSWFYANITGIKWFIKNILPHTDIRLTVAGYGMENLKDFYPESDKLHILGFVSNTNEVYDRADCVVAPIFDGAGIKIKTGDALRHWKTVVGTHEAFAGYTITNGHEGYICETVDEFIQAFKEIAMKQKTKINMASYTFYKKYLSRESAFHKMSEIINK